MNRIKYLVLASMLVLSLSVSAQHASKDSKAAKHTVSGKIVDAENGSAMELVNIVFENGAFWAVSDLSGKFSLELTDGEYHYEVSYVGYETAKGTVKVNGKDISSMTIKLQSSSLSLNEVVVTAKQKAMGSSSVIDQSALSHLQPKSVEDILQLMPGSLTQNPSLGSVGQANLREITDPTKRSSNSNNAMGASVIVDGAPVMNDATMQLLSTAKSGVQSFDASNSSNNTTGRGTDLRTISTDNIENIEVIRGIPSVEYGNLTSGAVIIKTKKGATPLEVKGKADPNSKMAYMGKGFTLNTGGTINMALDYTESYDDIRFQAEGFERITGDLGYSHTFFQTYPLSLNATLAYYRNINSVRVDKQQYQNETTESRNRGIRFGLNGDWNIKRKLVSNISYNLSVNYSRQDDYQLQQVILSTGATPVAVSTVPGEFQSYILNGTYQSEHTVSGRPVDVFAQLKGSKTIFVNDGFSSTFKEGLEFRYDVNHGEGLSYDPKYPPFVRNVQTVRPRPYTDIPAMKTWAGFFENKTLAPIGTTSLTMQAGVRANYMLIDRDYMDADNMLTIEPRVNAEWSFLTPRNNSLFDKLSVSAGWGLTSKMPPLVYLYPDKAYFDEKSFSYIDPSMNMDKSLSVMTTSVIGNTSNPDLKPSTGRKMEIGLNFEVKKISGNVTFFMEHYENEFSFFSTPFISTYRYYNTPADAGNFRYENGHLLYDTASGAGIQASYTNDSTFQSYAVPMNCVTTDKKGVEFSVNLGQIRAIRTSIVVDGAWLWVKRRSTQPSWGVISTPDPVTDEKTNYRKLFPYMALYPAGDGNISSRTNTNIRFITHIPTLSMVFSTTAQIVWSQWKQTIWQDESGNDLWYMARNQQSTDPTDIRPCVDPVGFRDFAGNWYEWNTEYRDINTHRRGFEMLEQYSYPKSFEPEHYPGYVLFNFRLTKQFGNRLELSFMANNMFNTQKIYKYENSAGYTKLTIPQYFGAEIKLKI